ncbi:hypothetical protein [Rhodococcus sp. WS3]|uniref:hypothetical protein n=1 Tax=Rhodococcus sp. WS3 TaxID=2486271 RepID=UPI001C9DD2A4|nr:hypothetical protein [Rhodococcus sp. WS3]
MAVGQFHPDRVWDWFVAGAGSGEDVGGGGGGRDTGAGGQDRGRGEQAAAECGGDTAMSGAAQRIRCCHGWCAFPAGSAWVRCGYGKQPRK